MDRVGHGLHDILKKRYGSLDRWGVDDLDVNEFADSIDGNIQVDFSLSGANIANIHVEIPKRISRELLAYGLVVKVFRKNRQTMTHEATVKIRARKGRD